MPTKEASDQEDERRVAFRLFFTLAALTSTSLSSYPRHHINTSSSVCAGVSRGDASEKTMTSAINGREAEDVIS